MNAYSGINGLPRLNGYIISLLRNHIEINKLLKYIVWTSHYLYTPAHTHTHYLTISGIILPNLHSTPHWWIYAILNNTIYEHQVVFQSLSVDMKLK